MLGIPRSVGKKKRRFGIPKEILRVFFEGWVRAWWWFLMEKNKKQLKIDVVVFFPWVFLLFHGFFVATLQLWNWKLALWGPHVFYFCRNCRSISWTACLLASKKKELNGFPYEGRCGEMFHKQPTNESIENDCSGSFDVLSKISLLTFCIQPKRWIPFPIHVLVWPDSKVPLDGIC